MYVLVVADGKGLHASNPFGDCSDLIRMTPWRTHLVIRIGRKAFLADTQGVRNTPVSEALDEERDAAIANPSSDYTSVFQPFLKPDWKIYRWCGRLEQATPGNADSTFKFAYVVTVGNGDRFSATSSEDADGLRIGGPICITGRYFENMQYETVIGAKRSMPLLVAYRVSAGIP